MLSQPKKKEFKHSNRKRLEKLSTNTKLRESSTYIASEVDFCIEDSLEGESIISHSKHQLSSILQMKNQSQKSSSIFDECAGRRLHFKDSLKQDLLSLSHRLDSSNPSGPTIQACSLITATRMSERGLRELPYIYPRSKSILRS